MTATTPANPNAATTSSPGVGSMVQPGAIRATASARVGLAGNPADALEGTAFAVPVRALQATVTARPAAAFSARTPDREWPSLDALATHVDQFGYQGAAPLLLGTLRVLNRSGLVPGDITPLALEWETQIPRSVGLAGSSALVIATLRACAAAWEIQLAPTQVASLAIDVERDELGIGAGWMDRVVQARDVPCLVRCATEPPEVTESVPAAFDVVVAWDPRGAAPSGRLHGPLKQRWLNGDSDVVEAVNELSALATQAHAAWAAPDRGPLCTAIDATLEVRRRIAATDAHTLELVELARRAGAAATNAGSGGAIAAVCRESGPAARKRLTDHLSAAGIPWCVAGSVETP